MIALALIILLLVLNALFVAAEFASVSVRRTQVFQSAEEGNVMAKLFSPYVSSAVKLDEYIAACQVGITLTSLLIGAIGQLSFGRTLAGLISSNIGMDSTSALSLATIIILLLLVGLQVVLGELLPKNIAVRYPLRTSLWTVLPMRYFLALFKPLIWLFNGTSAVILRAFRVPVDRRSFLEAGEIDILISESHQGGALVETEKTRAHQALRLAERKVRELMIPRTRVFAFDSATSSEEIVRQSIESPYTRIPVYEQSIDNVIGIVHIKDLLSASGESEIEIGSVIREIPRVLESSGVMQLMEKMRIERAQMALVVDEYGGTEGIITLEDLLEQVVGEIPDEYEKDDVGEIVQLEPGLFQSQGSVPLAMLEEQIDLTFDDEDADTINGLFMSRMARMPLAGDSFDKDGYAFTIIETDKDGTLTVNIERLPDATEKVGEE